MSNTVKFALLFTLIMVPLILLIEYATHDKHLTFMQGFRAISIQAIGFFLSQSIFQSIDKQQPKQQAKK